MSHNKTFTSLWKIFLNFFAKKCLKSFGEFEKSSTFALVKRTTPLNC